MIGKLASFTAIIAAASATYKSVTRQVKGDFFTYDFDFASDSCTKYYGMHAKVSIENTDLTALGVTKPETTGFSATFMRYGLRQMGGNVVTFCLIPYSGDAKVDGKLI